jgi:hypothetical protein
MLLLFFFAFINRLNIYIMKNSKSLVEVLDNFNTLRSMCEAGADGKSLADYFLAELSDELEFFEAGKYVQVFEDDACLCFVNNLGIVYQTVFGSEINTIDGPYILKMRDMYHGSTMISYGNKGVMASVMHFYFEGLGVGVAAICFGPITKFVKFTINDGGNTLSTFIPGSTSLN